MRQEDFLLNKELRTVPINIGADGIEWGTGMSNVDKCIFPIKGIEGIGGMRRRACTAASQRLRGQHKVEGHQL